MRQRLRGGEGDRRTAPELVFLDIQMPKLDGFEVVELAGAGTHYVFVTAYDQFALRAFEVHAIDYLLKPFGPSAWTGAGACARTPARAAGGLAAAGQRGAGAPQPLERILIRDGARVQVVPVGQIDYIEAQDDYVQDRRRPAALAEEPALAELETQLDPATFLRVHRSYIVNWTRIARIEPAGKDGHCAVLHTGCKLPVSRSGRK
jgi:two-component system LytT family response regulator